MSASTPTMKSPIAKLDMANTVHPLFMVDQTGLKSCQSNYQFEYRTWWILTCDGFIYKRCAVIVDQLTPLSFCKTLNKGIGVKTRCRHYGYTFPCFNIQYSSGGALRSKSRCSVFLYARVNSQSNVIPCPSLISI